MIYVTGDIHGNQKLWDMTVTPFLQPGDIVIVSGDFGIGFFDEKYRSEEMFFDHIAEQKYRVLFIDGNHENFEKLNSYEISEWNGGHVHVIRDNLIHLMRGEVFFIEGKKMFVMGGGYSIDRTLRVESKSWWPDEMPSEAEYDRATDNLKKCGYQVNYILTHTAPNDTVTYLSRIRSDIEDRYIEEARLKEFLSWIENDSTYEKWYFGHFHTDAELWKNQYVVLNAMRELHTGDVVRMRSYRQE